MGQGGENLWCESRLIIAPREATRRTWHKADSHKASRSGCPTSLKSLGWNRFGVCQPNDARFFLRLRSSESCSRRQLLSRQPPLVVLAGSSTSRVHNEYSVWTAACG